MKAAYTPGPWHWDGNTLKPEKPDFSRSDVHSILDAEGGYGFFGSDSRATLRELDADRALIAAAPDLLVALQAYIADCRSVDPDGLFCGEVQRAAMAAIAKATGAQT
jgi:hypothetical protein